MRSFDTGKFSIDPPDLSGSSVVVDLVDRRGFTRVVAIRFVPVNTMPTNGHPGVRNRSSLYRLPQTY